MSRVHGFARFGHGLFSVITTMHISTSGLIKRMRYGPIVPLLVIFMYVSVIILCYYYNDFVKPNLFFFFILIIDKDFFPCESFNNLRQVTNTKPLGHHWVNRLRGTCPWI